MFIVYEDAACLLMVLIGGTLLFAAGAICVMLWEAGGMAWRWGREFASGPQGLRGRWTAEPSRVEAALRRDLAG